MDKAVIAAIAFLGISFMIGIFFISGFSTGANADKSSLSYVDEESSLKSPFISTPNQQQQMPKQQIQPTPKPSSYNIPTPAASPTLTPSPSATLDQEKNITVSCEVIPSTAKTGQEVVWTASASGGNGTYTYSWSGNSPLDGKINWNEKVTYTEEGTKTGTVKVKSGSKEAVCTKTINISSDNSNPL